MLRDTRDVHNSLVGVCGDIAYIIMSHIALSHAILINKFSYNDLILDQRRKHYAQPEVHIIYSQH